MRLLADGEAVLRDIVQYSSTGLELATAHA